MAAPPPPPAGAGAGAGGGGVPGAPPPLPWAEVQEDQEVRENPIFWHKWCKQCS